MLTAPGKTQSPQQQTAACVPAEDLSPILYEPSNRSRGAVCRELLILGILVLLGGVSIAPIFPRSVTPATASPAAFSAELPRL